MSDDSEKTMDALLDTLLPGGAGYPPASAIGLGDRLRAHGRFGPATAAIMALLPPGFADQTLEARENHLRVLEESHPDRFGAGLTGVYSLYYSDPAVLAVIARTTGYTPRAPQPDGYALEPFDPAVVRVVAERPPHYRTVDGDRHGQ